ncbi:hypothetical protein BD769DRAFT_1383232 [Suillus cothurnatus]|nr:hypothetical protein BD769DRAFT_1383232 [Suillus cothurnatus]
MSELNSQEGHHKYLNHHGQPEALLKRLESIYVDGLISGVDIRKFMDDFSAQPKAQATMVYYLQGKMINFIILASIPSVLYLARYLYNQIWAQPIRKDRMQAGPQCQGKLNNSIISH